MSLLKKLSLSLLMLLAVVTYAQAVDVNTAADFNAEMNTTNPDIRVTTGITFTANVSSSTNKTVKIELSPGVVLDGGGNNGFNLTGSTMTFVSGANTSLSNFFKSGFGGAVYLNKSNATFSGTTTFTGNTANYGGAVLLVPSTATFSGTTIFSNNTAQYFGGAVYLENNSNATFSGNTIFSSNTASYGGAVYLYNGNAVTFEGTTVFSSNTATTSGGAVYLYYGTVVTFEGTTVFSSNTAATSGGAVYAEDDSKITFSGTTIFSGNTANSHGGAVFLSTGSYTAFSENTTFSGNRAGNSGGAVYLNNGSSATFSGTTTFSSNTANYYGGAVYLNYGSTATFNTNTGKLLFTGNKANGTINDIYMSTNSVLNFEATNNEIKLEGGIVSVNALDVINKTGKDTLYLGGINDINGSFNLNEGTLSIIKGSTVSFIGDEFNISRRSVFETNGTEIKTSTFNLNGLWVSNGEETITANKITIGQYSDFTLSKLEVGEKTYRIFESLAAISGHFEDKDLARVKYEYDFNNTQADVTVTVIDYSDIGGLSENGKEASKVLDKLYDDAYLENGEMWNKIINKTDAMTLAEYKKTANEIAGGFIANVITAGAENEWKGRAFREMRKEENKENLWINAGPGTKGYKEDDNVNGKFKDSRIGFEAGYGFYNSEKVKAGAAIGYNSHSMDQGSDEATMGEINGGLYAGMFSGKIELKGALKVGYQSYETTRKVIEESIEGSFSGFGINADIEAGYRIGWKENIDIVPFAGLGLGMVNTGSYEEEGGVTALEVESGSYMRTAATAGVTAEGKAGKMKWYGKAGLKLLLSGATGEIEGSFEGTKIKAVGTEQGTAGIEFGAGAEYAIKEGMSIFADAGLGAGTSSSMGGMLGIKMKVGK